MSEPMRDPVAPTEAPAPRRRVPWHLTGGGYLWCRPARRWFALLLVLLGLTLLVSWEMRSSTLQALYLARWADKLHYELQAGPSADNHYPKAGPFDERLGYTQLPAWSDRLSGRGFEVTAQARQSEALRRFMGKGFFAPYDDKNQAGLELRDCRGDAFFKAKFPRQIYAALSDVPPLVAQTLAFIENKELLAPAAPRSNPALEWKRLGRAVVDRAALLGKDEHTSSGGSTLATQLEKFRHSPQGRTASMKDKYRQMVSASVRAYQDGEETSGARERILLDYLNGLPLGARRGHGEVNGLLDGLQLWWGADPQAANAALRGVESDAADRGSADSNDTDESPESKTQPLQPSLQTKARAYRQMLSLLIAQRRPSFYLGAGQRRLTELTDSYLRLLAQAGVITPGLRDAALQVSLTALEGLDMDGVTAALMGISERPETSRLTTDPTGDRKAVSAARIELASLLELPRLYDLDRLDLKATSTLDNKLQTAVAATLRELRDPAAARKAGLVGDHLLASSDDPSQLFYSFTLFESKDGVNRVRVQTDNLDQPFDINTGAKLELGSTAKLRTLISYLEIVATLHQQLATLSPAELAKRTLAPRDRLGRWAVQHLRSANDKSLPAMLAAAMQRRYSASPGEVFFTGGGDHTFANFKSQDNARSPTVAEAFKDSINLVFIRLMRDVVDHTLVQGGRPVDRLMADRKHPERAALLVRFGEEESARLLRSYYRRHQRQTPEALDEFLAPPTGKTGSRPTPLELWVATQLRQNPKASMAALLATSRAQRRASYDWLLHLRDRGGQNNRIASLLEREAFVEIHRSWQRLGYPFERLVPSYASAIGSAGDRPAALAELMGIIVNDGLRQPVVQLEDLRFAAGTPYEMLLKRQAPQASQRVMVPEVAAVLRQQLTQVVEQGTARRLRGTLKGDDGKPLVVGGKTGTGDNRLESYNKQGGLIGSRAINRTATFVFFIGEHHFGTMTAYVPGANADDYSFTSSLPVQIVKHMAPLLTPVVRPQPSGEQNNACEAGRSQKNAAKAPDVTGG